MAAREADMRGFDDAAALAEGGACLGRVVAPRAVVDESLFLPKRVELPVEEEGVGTTKPWTSTAPSRRSRAAKAPPCVLDLVARLAAMFAVWCVRMGWVGERVCEEEDEEMVLLFPRLRSPVCGFGVRDLGSVWAWWWNEEAV